MHYCPFRHFRQLCIATKLTFVRLACLIHAANVRSEPESNPSKVIRFHAALRPHDERVASAITSSEGG